MVCWTLKLKLTHRRCQDSWGWEWPQALESILGEYSQTGSWYRLKSMEGGLTGKDVCDVLANSHKAAKNERSAVSQNVCHANKV